MSKVSQAKTSPTTAELEEELRVVQAEYDETERVRTGENWSMNKLFEIASEQTERQLRIISIMGQLLDRYQGRVLD